MQGVSIRCASDLESGRRWVVSGSDEMNRVEDAAEAQQVIRIFRDCFDHSDAKLDHTPGL